MKWVDALKEWNSGKIWCIPRKGTPDYYMVKGIMDRKESPTPKKEEEPKWKKLVAYYNANPFFWDRANQKERDDLYYELQNASISTLDERVPKWARIGYKNFCGKRSKGERDCIKPELNQTESKIKELKDDLIELKKGNVPEKYRGPKRSKSGFVKLQNTIKNQIDKLENDVKKMKGGRAETITVSESDEKEQEEYDGSAKKKRKEIKKDRKPNKWIIALKKWNEGNDRYCVPSRGTPQYNEIKKIMEKL